MYADKIEELAMCFAGLTGHTSFSVIILSKSRSVDVEIIRVTHDKKVISCEEEIMSYVGSKKFREAARERAGRVG